jgi:hypothetical protein
MNDNTAESTVDHGDDSRMIESRRVYHAPVLTQLGPIHSVVACAPTPGPDGCTPDCSHC